MLREMMLCASSLAMALLLLAGCEDERYGKLKSRTRGAINKRGEGGKWEPGSTCQSWLSPGIDKICLFFFFAGSVSFFGAKSPKCEKKSKYSVFLHTIAKFPQHKNINFFAYLESDFNLATFL